MTEQNRTENRTGNVSHVAETAQAITLAATVAMLGLSLGVDVPQLFASPPGEMVPSNQFKVDGTQMKEKAVQHKLDSIQHKDNAIQQKLDAVQDKQPVRPGMKPVNPVR
ncbi:MAG: hypothetical protein ABIR36_02765 [Nitrospiraceae bacterium]